jgi:hypothetical protein
MAKNGEPKAGAATAAAKLFTVGGAGWTGGPLATRE